MPKGREKEKNQVWKHENEQGKNFSWPADSTPSMFQVMKVFKGLAL